MFIQGRWVHSITISVVDATRFSFLEWVDGAVFTPALGVKIDVTPIEYGSQSVKIVKQSGRARCGSKGQMATPERNKWM